MLPSWLQKPIIRNFEAMKAADRGSLLMGFRHAVPEGKTLTAERVHPADLLSGAPPVLTPPVLLPLSGNGVSALSSFRGEFPRVAAPRDYDTSKLYRWKGYGAPASPIDIDFTRLNPEAFFTPEDRNEVLVISDDGTHLIDGRACKRLDHPQKK